MAEPTNPKPDEGQTATTASKEGPAKSETTQQAEQAAADMSKAAANTTQEATAETVKASVQVADKATDAYDGSLLKDVKNVTQDGNVEGLATKKTNDVLKNAGQFDAGELTKAVGELSGDSLSSTEGGYAEMAESGFTLARTAEQATSRKATEEERKDATTDFGREAGGVGTAAAVTVVANVALDGESSGVGAAGSGNYYAWTEAVNKKLGSGANAAGLHKVQESVGLGTGKKYERATDIATDAVTSTVGKQVSDFDMQERNMIDQGLTTAQQKMGTQDATGVTVDTNTFHHEAQAGLRTGEAVSRVAGGHTTDLNIDKITQEGTKAGVEKKVIDEQTAKDVNTAAQATEFSVNAAQGDFSAQTVAEGTEIGKEVTQRAHEHDIIDEQTTKDAKTGLDVVKAGANTAEGDFSAKNVSEIAQVTGDVSQRAQEHDVIEEQTAKDIDAGVSVVQAGADTASGDISAENVSQIAQATSKVSDSAEKHEIIDAQTNQTVQDTTSAVKSTSDTYAQGKALFSKLEAVESELESKEEDSFEIDQLFHEEDKAHPPITTQAHHAQETAKEAKQEQKQSKEEESKAEEKSEGKRSKM